MTEYSMGSQGKVERTAAGVNAIMSQFKARLRPLTQNITEAMNEVSKMWLALIINKQGGKIAEKTLQFKEVKITIQDLLKQYDITFILDSLHSASKNMLKEQMVNATPILMNLVD